MMFGWLPLSDRKGLPTPRVLFRHMDWCSGCFVARTHDRFIEDWLDIDRSEGDVIVLSTAYDDIDPSVIAHEHRHFQQHYFQSLPRLGACIPFDPGDGSLEAWNVGIRNFYRSQPWEMDALRYELRIAKTEKSESQRLAVMGMN